METATKSNSLESVKLELTQCKQAIESLTSMNVPIPASLQDTYDKLLKKLQGNNSQQTADLFNTTFASKINDAKNHELKAAILKLAGESGVRLKITKTAEGNVTFEAAGSIGGGAKTGNVGVTRSSSEFNNYEVTMDGKPIADSPFESASAALKAIINGGQNPMNLPAGYGTGNSAVRVLESLKKNEVFNAHYVVTGSKVEKTKPEVTAPAKA